MTFRQAQRQLDCARRLYNIPLWSEGYFDINQLGHAVATPNESTSIDLMEVADQLQQRGLSFPVLVRFPQILRARVRELCQAFKNAAHKGVDQVKHIPFYPIKVNQQRTVIETIITGSEQDIGLEVGSKTELLVALGLLSQNNGLLICNGYKDRAYIRIALHAQRMGIKVFIVVENLSELLLIKAESEALRVAPVLGVRIRLASVAAGNWQNSGGRHAKFGLNTGDVLALMKTLQTWRKPAWLKMLHFHMGSQISSLSDFSQGLQEGLCVYAALDKRGFALEYLDVGGGLAIDYSSQQDASYFSRSYTVQDYAEAVVDNINLFCRQNNLDRPIVCTENGRAMTAHHAMLMTDILAVDSQSDSLEPAKTVSIADAELQKLSVQVRRSLAHLNALSEAEINTLEQALHAKFLINKVSLEERAWIESLIHEYKIALVKNRPFDDNIGSDKYYCNFSVFQSMPDVWGLGQIFPVMPLARLNEVPRRQARLHDLTCDSDGQICQYALDGGVKDNLYLHAVEAGQAYILGFFLLGAYQEVLGDMHNLFGDTHAVNVEQTRQGLLLTEIEVGDCADELLNSVHLAGRQIIAACNRRLAETALTGVHKNDIINEIKDALFGYTYPDSIDRPGHRIKS